jgi:hypothetical protein
MPLIAFCRSDLAENVFGVRDTFALKVCRWVPAYWTDLLVHHKRNSVFSFIYLGRSEVRLCIFCKEVVLIARRNLLDSSLARGYGSWNLNWNVWVALNNRLSVTCPLTACRISILLLGLVEVKLCLVESCNILINSNLIYFLLRAASSTARRAYPSFNVLNNFASPWI